MWPVTYVKASQGISSCSSRKSFNIVIDVSRSESLNSYLMLNPKGPNFLLSYITAWKNDNPNKSFLNDSGFLHDSNWDSFNSA